MDQTVGLADLHKRGQELTITADEGQVVVWIQKMSVGEQDEAFRRGRAKSAVVLSATRNHGSDDFAVVLADAYALGDRDAAVDFLVQVKMRKARQAAKVDAELAAEDEWSNDGYLEGLSDAWQQGLKDRWADDPEDAEAKRVFAEMERFSTLAAAELERVREDMRSEWDGVQDDDVYEKAAVQLADSAADEAFNGEYWRCQMWQSTRHHHPNEDPTAPHPEHNERYFTSRAAVDDLSPETFAELRLGFALLEIDDLTGKGSPAGPASSTLSEPAEKVGTPESSGLQTATA